MLEVVGEQVVKEHNIYIKDWKTDLEIGTEAARITRYNPYIVETQGISPEEAFPVISKALDECDYVMGHNILGFDLYLIKEYYKMFGRDYRHLVDKIIDTNCLAKAVKTGLNYSKDKYDSLLDFQYPMQGLRQKGLKSSLTALGKEYNLEFDEEKLHDGIFDLYLNLQVWNKLKYSLDI